MSGTLFVVATPIGNLEDITLRALRVLREADVIAAEDTRRTSKLLAHYSIPTPTLSFHEHNTRTRLPQVLARLERGENVALVSDAGTPGISDPGVELIRACSMKGFAVDPIPGASAPLAAAVASGFPLDPLTIFGFAPTRSVTRKKWLARLQAVPDTLTFFESPHRIEQAVSDIRLCFGERPIVIAREVTKVHQEFVRFTRGDEIGQTPAAKGEFTGAVLSAALLGSAIMLADSLQHVTQNINQTATGWGLLALVSTLAFIWRIRRARSPILPPVMFKNGRFTLAALTSLASFVSQGITFVALPFLFQSVYGYSPVVSALLFTPWPIGIVLIAPHAGRWADTISAPLISTIGLMIFVGGLLLLATLPESPSAWNICLRSLVCGIGFGCFQSPNNREMLSNVAREYASYASGVLSIVRTFGQCLGAAAVGVLLATTESDHDRAVHLALWIAVIASTGSVLFSVSRLRPAVRASA